MWRVGRSRTGKRDDVLGRQVFLPTNRLAGEEGRARDATASSFRFKHVTPLSMQNLLLVDEPAASRAIELGTARFEDEGESPT